MIPGNDTGTTAHRRSADGDSILPHGNSEMRSEREESPPRENGGGEPKYACESFGSLQQNSDASDTGANAPSPPSVAPGPSRRALTLIRSKERSRALAEGPDEVGDSETGVPRSMDPTDVALEGVFYSPLLSHTG
jgi:hypothetical protein